MRASHTINSSQSQGYEGLPQPFADITQSNPNQFDFAMSSQDNLNPSSDNSANFHLTATLGRVVEKQLQQSLAKFINEIQAKVDSSDKEPSNIQEKLEQIYDGDNYQQLQEKMTKHFTQKSDQNIERSKNVLEGYNSLLKDIRLSNQGFTKFTEDMKKKNGGIRKEEVGNPEDSVEGRLDVTEILKNYKLRSEIERAFFFHMFYHILREQFGKPDHIDIFDRPDLKPIEIHGQSIKCSDIKAVVEARKRFNEATPQQRALWLREREERIIYKPDLAQKRKEEREKMFQDLENQKGLLLSNFYENLNESYEDECDDVKSDGSTSSMKMDIDEGEKLNKKKIEAKLGGKKRGRKPKKGKKPVRALSLDSRRMMGSTK